MRGLCVGPWNAAGEPASPSGAALGLWAELTGRGTWPSEFSCCAAELSHSPALSVSTAAGTGDPQGSLGPSDHTFLFVLS